MRTTLEKWQRRIDRHFAGHMIGPAWDGRRDEAMDQAIQDLRDAIADLQRLVDREEGA